MPKEKNEAGKAISSAKGIVNEDRIENIRAVRKRAQERIKRRYIKEWYDDVMSEEDAFSEAGQVDTTSPENEDYLDSMTQKVYTSDKDK